MAVVEDLPKPLDDVAGLTHFERMAPLVEPGRRAAAILFADHGPGGHGAWPTGRSATSTGLTRRRSAMRA